jgi:hypothetical protein
MTDSFVENVNEIDAVAVDDDDIAAYTSENQFNALTAALLKEVASFVCVAACVLPTDTKVWSRNQAIYGGHLVRLFKLTRSDMPEPARNYVYPVEACIRDHCEFGVLCRVRFARIVRAIYQVFFAAGETASQPDRGKH